MEQLKKTNYPVIEFINGQTLFDIKNLHLTEFEKFGIMLDLLSIFGYFQENHFIYRDLKPDNIMIDQNKTICLTDFDRMILDSDEPNIVDLSPFKAPEVDVDIVTNKCDVYSLGMIFYYILCEKIQNVSDFKKFW